MTDYPNFVLSCLFLFMIKEMQLIIIIYRLCELQLTCDMYYSFKMETDYFADVHSL